MIFKCNIYLKWRLKHSGIAMEDLSLTLNNVYLLILGSNMQGAYQILNMPPI
jgi:hypothetical protein